jgi:hypothetical protein
VGANAAGAFGLIQCVIQLAAVILVFILASRVRSTPTVQPVA